MKREVFKDKEDIIAIILRDGVFPKGLCFYNDEKDFLQLASWNYPKGKKVDPHRHIITQKPANRTQELFIVKKGKIKTDIYNERDKKIAATTLNKGDVVLFLKGGHGFEMLEENTQVFMIKNGPYFGKEKDKTSIKGF